MATLSYYPHGHAKLGLSILQNSGSLPPSRLGESTPQGLKGLSPRGGDIVCSVAAVMEEEFGTGGVAMFTGTLPELPLEKLLLNRKKWPLVVRDFHRELMRLLKHEGGSIAMTWVTEIHPQRLKYTGHIYPHLHLLYNCSPKGSKRLYLDYRLIQSIWDSQVKKHYGIKFTTTASTQCKRVRKSAVGYMGKYLTKGVGKEVEKAFARLQQKGLATREELIGTIPPSWCGRTKEAWDMTESRIFEKIPIEDGMSDGFLNLIGVRSQPIEKEWNGRVIRLGWSLWAKDGAAKQRLLDYMYAAIPTRDEMIHEAKLKFARLVNGQTKVAHARVFAGHGRPSSSGLVTGQSSDSANASRLVMVGEADESVGLGEGEHGEHIEAELRERNARDLLSKQTRIEGIARSHYYDRCRKLGKGVGAEAS
jgi:hypothetical protein